MPRLFLSHSSKDNIPALAFQRWLEANGWSKDDVFIDLHGIGAGERWRETLRKANSTCEAIILLASPDSIASIECQKELELAEVLGKAIIPVILRDLTKDDPRLARYAERQFVDLSAQPTERMELFEHDGRVHRVEFNAQALAAIKTRLEDLGVDATHIYEADRAAVIEALAKPGSKACLLQARYLASCYVGKLRAGSC